LLSWVLVLWTRLKLNVVLLNNGIRGMRGDIIVTV